MSAAGFKGEGRLITRGWESVCVCVQASKGVGDRMEEEGWGEADNGGNMLVELPADNG